MAAEECTATSVVTSSSSSPTLHGHSWWDILHPAAAPANSLSSWTGSNTTTWRHHHHHHHHQNPNSNSSNCDQEDGVSITTSLTTNASNHSGLTVESSGRHHQLVDQPVSQSNNFIGEHVSDNHIWSHVLSSVPSNGDFRNGQDVGENLFEAVSSKTTSNPGIFEPACDYLKKIDTNNWEFPNSSSVFNNFVKNLNGYTNDHDNHHQSSIESGERLTKLSNLISNWSIAPPGPEVSNLQFNPKTCDEHQHMSLTPPSSLENYSQQPAAFCGMAAIKNPFLSCYGHHQHDVKMEAETLGMEPPSSYFRRAFKGSNHSNGYHHHDNFINNSSMETDNFYGSPMSHSSSTSTINYSRLSKPLIDIHVPNRPGLRPLNTNLSDCKKQGLQAAATSLQTRSNNGRTHGISSEGKKKRSEETSPDTVLKKPKQESSTTSSVKMQTPKVKLGDRITALQQIVSPFGKTDTASVLLEAIGYINFLQEQVQLLSNPYMKPNSHNKDPWGSLDRKEQKGDSKVDLTSRGLCLVPISCTPQVYHESTGSDYWTPTYRGCLYR